MGAPRTNQGPNRSSTSATRQPSCGSGRTNTRANIHTLDGACGNARARSVSGSRLHQTTEAYRQNRGTTARTVEEVGRATMTAEKAAQVDKAREKVLGEKACARVAGAHRPASAVTGGVVRSGKPPVARPAAPNLTAGYRLGKA